MRRECDREFSSPGMKTFDTDLFFVEKNEEMSIFSSIKKIIS